MKKDNIELDTHYGTWYVIDEAEYNGNMFYLLESEECALCYC